MGLNIHIPTFSELHADLRTSIGGKWKVSVVDTNRGNHEFFPLGDVWRPNLILNQGKDRALFQGSRSFASSAQSWSGFVLGHGATTLGSQAAIGTSNTAAAASQTALIAQTQTTTTKTPGTPPTSSNDTVNGARTYTCSWDFSIVMAPVALNEAGIFAGDSDSGFQGPMFTRFVFPSAVNLLAGQFLRLTYALTISTPSIVTPVPVALSSGGFDGTGDIQVVGTFDNIFGTIVSSSYGRGPARGNFISYVTTKAQVKIASAILCDSSVSFPAVNSALSITGVGTRIDVGASLSVPNYTNGTYSLSPTYYFIAGNPAVDTNVGGILFRCAQDATYTYGTLWKFDAPQNKEALKSLVLNLTQSVSAP